MYEGKIEERTGVGGFIGKYVVGCNSYNIFLLIRWDWSKGFEGL